MPPRGARRTVLGLCAAVLVVAACGSPAAEPSPSPTPSPTTSPTSVPSTSPSAVPSEDPTATPTEDATDETAGPTEDDTLVLAGQFTAFVGADGSGPACNAFWWADALGGAPYVGLSDGRGVTAAGRVEPLCLLGFDGAVELTVVDPDGGVATVAVDATLADGGVGVLEVATLPAAAGQVVPVAWQPAAGPAQVPDPSPSAHLVVAQDATGSPGPSEPSGDPTTTPSEDPTTATTESDPTEASEEETEDVLDAEGVRVEWAVPVDARGDYAFTARQGDREATAVVRVVAPSRLEVGPEAGGVRVVTLRDGPGQPVPLGLYAKSDTGDLVATDGYRGKDFALVTDLGTIASGESVAVDVSDLGFGHWCVISPAVAFVDCQADAADSSGWTQ